MTPYAIKQREKRALDATFTEVLTGERPKGGPRQDGTLSMTPSAIKQREKRAQQKKARTESGSQSTGSQLAHELKDMGMDNPRPGPTMARPQTPPGQPSGQYPGYFWTGAEYQPIPPPARPETPPGGASTKYPGWFRDLLGNYFHPHRPS
jgi:hypothetical protein